MNETNHPARRLRHGERLDDAAANKAAEEGGLPQMPEGVELGWSKVETPIMGFTPKMMRAYARQAIAADRASRQVANKADVEPSDSYKAGYADGMEEGAKLAFWGDKPSEKFPEGWPAEIWLNAGDDELGPFSEYDEVSWCSAPQGESDIRYIREDLLVTPPATTGASTAREAILEEAAKAVECLLEMGASTDVVYDEGFDHGVKTAAENIRCLIRHPVGASTVLTDERIIEMAHAHGVESREFSDAETIALVREVEREVAAQAGQVAVPDTCSLPPEGWYCTRPAGHDGPCAAWPCDQKVEYLAAPSPAKESK